MRRGALFGLVVVALLAAACGGGGGGGGGRTVKLSDGSVANDHGSATVSGATASIQAGDYFFSPTILTGPPGQEVTLTVTNEGKGLHNFSLPGQNINVDLQPGQKTTVTVRFPASGAVTFECKYHLAQNMRGELRAG